MSREGFSRPWDAQPQDFELARNELTRNAVMCLPLAGGIRDLVQGAQLQLAGGTFDAHHLGRSLRAVATGGASIPVDLSSFGAVTLSFWMYWDAYANDDALAMEYGGPNFFLGTGFIVDPNSGAPASGEFQVGIGRGGPSAFNTSSFARPSAAAWHHYLVTFDRYVGAGASANACYIDGKLQSLTSRASDAIGNNFGNDSLYLFSRSNSSLYGAGRTLNLLIRGGIPGGVDTLARDEYENPWKIYAPRRIPVPQAAAGGSSHTTTGALAASAASASGTAVRTAIHPTSGVLAASAATAAGTAAHLTLHASTGALAASAATAAGAALHPHASTGALAAAAATLAGTAARATAGAHAADGALAASAATLAGAATRLALHTTSGALAAAVATLAGTSARAALTVKSINLLLTTNGSTPAANLTGLKWAFFDQTTPDLMTAPTAKGSGATTTADGMLVLNVNLTALSAGDTGWLVVSDSDGLVGSAESAFAGPALVVEL